MTLSHTHTPTLTLTTHIHTRTHTPPSPHTHTHPSPHTHTHTHSILDGQVRVYHGSRSFSDLVDYIEEEKWKSEDPVPWWRSPTATQYVVHTHTHRHCALSVCVVCCVCVCAYVHTHTHCLECLIQDKTFSTFSWSLTVPLNFDIDSTSCLRYTCMDCRMTIVISVHTHTHTHLVTHTQLHPFPKTPQTLHLIEKRNMN